ncbi:Hypothetical predicted protein [Octopus vulgaris]|uniref:Uncharacterized protein n=1 Tax=Octopus vulgaris TaxID=6645 RepID=A0AA36AYJ2_OCTVU|nr:Hypothetical predicted protein [Octopus vulgaris]
MADSETEVTSTSTIMKNDPWTPLPSMSANLPPAPKDPLYDMISSEEYLESLNRRLQQIKLEGQKEPTSKDIIKELALKKADIMKNFLEEGGSLEFDDANALDDDNFQSYFQRKFCPERQALSTEELITLLQADELTNQVENNSNEESVDIENREI